MQRVPQAASFLGSLDKGCLPGSADTRQPEMELRALETPEDGDAEVRGDRREAERQSRKKQRERQREHRQEKREKKESWKPRFREGQQRRPNGSLSGIRTQRSERKGERMKGSLGLSTKPWLGFRTSGCLPQVGADKASETKTPNFARTQKQVSPGLGDSL